MIVAETGSEGHARARWLRYVVRECVRAMRDGCELHAVTLYPIVNHPGWIDGRHCENGLWDYASEDGSRAADPALTGEIRFSTPRLEAARARMLRREASAEPPAAPEAPASSLGTTPAPE